MKYLIIALFLVSSGAMAQRPIAVSEEASIYQELDNILIDRLLALSRTSHTGTPVGDFLSSEAVQGYTDMAFRYTPSGQIDYLMVQYSPKVFLSIYSADTDAIRQAADFPDEALAAFRNLPISKIGVRFIMLQEGDSRQAGTLE